MSTRRQPAAVADVANVDVRTRAALDEHYEAVWRFVRRLGVPEADVEDAAQRVFVVFATHADGVATGTDRSFLLGTALRVASQARRSRARSTRELDTHAEAKDVEAHVDPAPGLGIPAGTVASRIAPGATYQQGTYEGDAWRVRAPSSELLAEIAPSSPDTTTYVTAP